ncbi:glutamyl-tRNA reductase [Nakamurella panacisegetis]|uniref:Glutamyl-tRNA reductase n=1 Tax=Nakamurella panacisegetis TaxID=1090615 RepID=A0A1H0HTF4_9ACTN|nr:glutamyl-tRNA reductase [Nakamurella panacisegetis]SDO22360.1 glutamyl-tRNA reductase [Nakamurella panacisegetis]
MLMVLGASHHDLELKALERLSASTDSLSQALRELSTQDGSIRGAVVLATCNRLEIYLDADRFHDAIDAVTHRIAEVAQIDEAEAAALLKVRVGAPVAAHLFTVASGLDSMVVGEAEISGQVSRALTAAHAARTTTPVLHSLFQSAARTAKQVASRTGLGSAGRSVASVAIDIATAGLAEPGSDESTSLATATCLIIGTGAYARVVATALRARGCTRLQVFSPSGRADTFAATHHAEVVHAGQFADAVAKADLVVACSGTTGNVLDVETVTAALALRDTPLPVVDLALRPDVSEGVRALPGVRVVDLHSVADGAAPEHREAIADAQDVVIAAVARFEDDQAIRTLDPAVIALRQHVSLAVEKEMVRLRAKYDSDVAAEVELAMHRVTQSLLHTPTLRAKELARTGDGAGYLQALHTLFGIEIPDQPAPH